MQSLRICGHCCPTFRDSSGVAVARAEASLQPLAWQTATFCDRHDVRHMLDCEPPKAQSSTDTESIERLAIDEAYRYLPPWAGGAGFVEATAPEVHIEILRENAAGLFELADLQLEDSIRPSNKATSLHHGGVPPPCSLLQPHTVPNANASASQTPAGTPPAPQHPLADGAYVQPYPLQLPPGAAVPALWRQHRLIQRTAYQVAANPALEVLLLVRQGGNTKLAHLQPGDPLHGYYTAVKARAQQGLPAAPDTPPDFPCSPSGGEPPPIPADAARGGLVDYDSDSSRSSSSDTAPVPCSACAAPVPGDPLAHAFRRLPASVWTPEGVQGGGMQRLLQRWTAYCSTTPPSVVRDAACSIASAMGAACVQHWREELWRHRTQDLGGGGRGDMHPLFLSSASKLSAPHRLLALKAACQGAVKGSIVAALGSEAAATAAAPQAAVMQLHNTSSENGSAFTALRSAVLLAAAALSVRACGDGSSHCDVLPPDAEDATGEPDTTVFGCRVDSGILSMRLHVPQGGSSCLVTPLHMAVGAPSSTQVQAIAAAQGTEQSFDALTIALVGLVSVQSSADAGSACLQVPGRLGARKRRRFGAAAGEEGTPTAAEVRPGTGDSAAAGRLERAKLLRGRFAGLTSAAGQQWDKVPPASGGESRTQ